MLNSAAITHVFWAMSRTLSFLGCGRCLVKTMKMTSVLEICLNKSTESGIKTRSESKVCRIEQFRSPAEELHVLLSKYNENNQLHNTCAVRTDHHDLRVTSVIQSEIFISSLCHVHMNSQIELQYTLSTMKSNQYNQYNQSAATY